MVTRDDVMELLLNVSPSFKEKWEAHLQDIWDRESESILYTDFGEFAKHLLELVEHKEFGEIIYIFNKIEWMLQEGDSFVKEAIVVGLLEDFQNVLLSNGYELNVMNKYLKPETYKYWVKVIKFWNGEIKYIDND